MTAPRTTQKRTELEREIREVEDLLEEGSDDYDAENDKLKAKFEKFEAADVLELIEASEKIKDYCNRQSTLWQNSLKAQNYLGKTIPSLVKDKKCSSLDQFVGQYLFGLWKQNKNLQILDKACDRNIFPALAARCEYNLKELARVLPSASETTISNLESKIVADVERINNQYWAHGYIYSYTVFMKLAELYHIATADLREENSGQARKEHDFLQNALECEMMAVKLLKYPVSETIATAHGLGDWVNNPVGRLKEAEELVLKALNVSENSSVYTEATTHAATRFKGIDSKVLGKKI